MTGVSFLITVYNKAPYLRGVLEAAARQVGEFEREFVIVDDGSTDGSRALARELTAGWRNVRLVEQANHGASAAMNAAAAAARMPYLKPVDADDLLVPDATSWLLDALHRHDAVMAYGDGGDYDLGTAPTWPALAGPPPTQRIDDPMTMMLRQSFISPSYILLRAASYNQVGGCKEHVIPQDYSLQLKLAALGAFAHVRAPVALMPRVAPGRLSDNAARVLHDCNLLLYECLGEAALTPAQRRLAARRATGRAWNYRRRAGGATPMWASWLRFVVARTPLPIDPRSLVAASCGDFGVPSQLDGWRPYPQRR